MSGVNSPLPHMLSWRGYGQHSPVIKK